MNKKSIVVVILLMGIIGNVIGLGFRLNADLADDQATFTDYHLEGKSYVTIDIIGTGMDYHDISVSVDISGGNVSTYIVEQSDLADDAVECSVNGTLFSYLDKRVSDSNVLMFEKNDSGKWLQVIIVNYDEDLNQWNPNPVDLSVVISYTDHSYLAETQNDAALVANIFGIIICSIAMLFVFIKEQKNA